MKICPKCNTKNSSDSKFCIWCGENILNVENISKEIKSSSENISEKWNEIFEKFKSLQKNQRIISISALVWIVWFFLDFSTAYDESTRSYFTSLFKTWWNAWFLFILSASILGLQYLFLIQKKDIFSEIKSNLFKIIISTFVLSLWISIYFLNWTFVLSELIISNFSDKWLWFYMIFWSFISIFYFSFVEIFNILKRFK